MLKFVRLGSALTRHISYGRRMPFYAVARGRRPGIYPTWADCEPQVKAFPDARYKKFKSKPEAQKFLTEHSSDNKIREKFSPKPKLKVQNSNSDDAWSDDDIFYEALSAHRQQYNEAISGLPPSKARGGFVAPSTSTGGYAHMDSPHKSNDKFAQYMKNDKWVVVYTDGAAKNNQRKNEGSSGCGVYWGDHRRESYPNPSTGASQNTNNFAEAHAIEYALKHAVHMGMTHLEIRTDSKYCINSLDTWIHGWIKKAHKSRDGFWRNGKGDRVVHQTVFENITKMRKKVKTKFVHVKGHSGDHGNDEADKLAVQGAEEYMRLKFS